MDGNLDRLYRWVTGSHEADSTGERTVDTSMPYRCQGCGRSFEVQYHVCPECGGYSVDRVPDVGVD